MDSRKNILIGMLRENPEDVFLKYALALELRKEGSNQANTVLTEIIRDNPDYVPAWQQLGSWLSEDGSTGEAIKTLRNGIEKAKEQGEQKAAAEMSEMLMMIEDD